MSLPDGPLVVWSARVYSWIAATYPSAVRRHYEGPMLQLFHGQARDAWCARGVPGLGRLWVRTLVDWGISVVEAYWREGSKAMVRVTLVVGMLYIAVLAVLVGVGATRFGEFYEAPAFSRYGVETVDENALLAAYEQALQGEFGSYRGFALGGSLAASLLLALGAALFGLSQRSVPLGLLALAVGTALTFAALSILPTVWFPLDRYPVAALWTMGPLPATWIAWAVLTAVGRYLMRTRPQRTIPARP